jgi:uncharacterized repeat protein (TIGR01451 family)
VKVAPELDRVFMIVAGDLFAAYRLSSFPNDVTKPLVEYRPGQEQYAPFLFDVDPTREGSGWTTFGVDGEPLRDFDYDDRGNIALAYGAWGWGLVDATGALLNQQTNQSGRVVPGGIELLRVGSSYYALVFGTAATDVYDVTNASAPVFLRTLPLGIRHSAEQKNGSSVAVMVSGTLQIFDKATLVAGGAPEAIIVAEGGGIFVDVTSDHERFIGVELIYAHNEFTTRLTVIPFSSPFVPSRYVVAEGYNPSGVNAGGGWVTLFGDDRATGYAPERFFAMRDGVPVYLGRGVLPQSYVRARDVVPFSVGGHFYAVLAMYRIGDVVELPDPTVDVSITKTATPQAVAVVGSNVTYDISVTNLSATNVTQVQVTDVLPLNARFVSVSPSGLCTGTTTIVCSFETIGRGVTVPVRIVAEATAPGDLTNTATLTALGDSSAANNRATTSSVEALPSTAVPTLSEWMLILLALTLAVVAGRAVR